MSQACTAQVIVFALRNMAPYEYGAEKRARLDLPKIHDAKSAMEAIAAVSAAFARGEIDAPHAETIVSMARAYIQAVETTDIERRLLELDGEAA